MICAIVRRTHRGPKDHGPHSADRSIEASGKVFNLKRLSDFNGNYAAVDAGLTAAGGAGVAAMKNQNGVTVELVSTTRGVEISLGGAGVDMKIKK
jgi:hypothetical protein